MFKIYLKKIQSDPSLWRIIFIVTSVVSIIGNSVFVFFGSVEIQKWNEPEKVSEKNNDGNIQLKTI